MSEPTGSTAATPRGATNNSPAAQAATASPELADLIRAYFRRVALEDQPRRSGDIVEIVRQHRDMAGQRTPGRPLVRVYNPQAGTDGWGSTSTVVDVVTDDMPYLVDSVIAELGRSGLMVHRVIHPILAVQRNADGILTDVLGEASAAPRGADESFNESWMHLLVDRVSDEKQRADIAERVSGALDTARAVVSDSAAMAARAREVANQLRLAAESANEAKAADLQETANLLEWMSESNVIFLGYRDRGLAGVTEPANVRTFGLLRADKIGMLGVAAGELDQLAVHGTLTVHQLWLDSALGRGQGTLLVSVAASGNPDRDRRSEFLISLTPRARNAEITSIPVLRRTVQQVLDTLGADPTSYTGQRALAAMAAYPRAEMLWATLNQVIEVVSGRLRLSSRRRVRAFLQPDPQGHFLSVLVFLPRDRYSTDRRLEMQRILTETFDGTDCRYTAHIGGSLLASVHFTIATDPAASGTVDVADLNRKLRAAVRSWEDQVAATIVGSDEELDTAGAMSRYVDAFDEAYKEDYDVANAIEDLKRLDALTGPEDLGIAIVRPPEGAPGDSRLKLYTAGATLSLSAVMPIFQSMGVHVIDERPYQVRRTDGTISHIYDFGMEVQESQRTSGAELVDTKRRFADAFVAAWRGWSEVDGFNELVLAARLDWRQITALRGYAKYLRQIGSNYTQGYIEQVLATQWHLTADLAALFDARFDPSIPEGQRTKRSAEVARRINSALDDVTSLDADRIVRTYLSLIEATARTNAFIDANRTDEVPYVAYKLEPQRIPGVPKPVPSHEIWVYSPRVEGLHLRFGAVARGGLRWSDRPEDFRTEVLGLVKAQEVKNAIIVPVGAKGGFVVKQPPSPTGDVAADRDATQAEGVACYTAFISCLLDVTDNRKDGKIVPPAGVVRYDADDPYMVVAADKGTARFSDIANGVSAKYDFWLGDAFASGGSAGYDHKGMGITARGAWESVKHHFRELGVDVQNEDFTCVGIGDMSGDVFGNGMLRSKHTKLVAAFDHRHVFVDPDPDPAASFQERQRLYDLPRSSWADYRTELISVGGGVWPRTAKSIPISAQMRAVLGLEHDVTELTPAALIRAVLCAPVDLVYNGGIGTYIKASVESHVDVGNKANDAVRVDGADLRARVVGEGGNLGVTQLGRIEYALAGGKINTDAIDNSAGVDASDHEVNIKIAMQPLLADGTVTVEDRNTLLHSMTETVAELVLADNKAQNRLLGVTRHHAHNMTAVHGRQIDALVADGHLDRQIEFLPSDKAIAARQADGIGLVSPELAVLIAYTKSFLARAMLASDLPDDPAYQERIVEYFPPAMVEKHEKAVRQHPLAREIVTTMTVNELVNEAGITYAYRLGEEIAASPVDAIRAYTVVRSVFDLPELVGAINAADHEVPAACQDYMTLLVRRVLDRAARWFLSQRPQPLDVRAEIDRYRPAVNAIRAQLPDLVTGVEQENVTRDIADLESRGATPELAKDVAYCLYLFSALDIFDAADKSGRDLLETAGLYYALSAHLGFDDMLTEVSHLPRLDRWHSLARQAVRDDIYRSMRMITADALSTTAAGEKPTDKIAAWEEQNASRLARARATLDEIARDGAGDLATLSVAARELRSMVR